MKMSVGNLLDLTGSHYLVTGAGSGIGRAIAELFAALGAKLSLVDVDDKALEELLLSLPGDSHQRYGFDLHDVDRIDDLLRVVVSTCGPLNGIVHSAGTQSIVPARDLRPDVWRRIFAVNSEAALALAKNMGKKRISANTGGAIILISSVMGLAGSAGSVAYSMSKSALHGLARSLALELAPSRIRVNCIAPGFVRTPMLERLRHVWGESQERAVEALHPLGLGIPEDIANAAAFLAAGTGRWITGTVLVVDGGYLAH